MERHRARCPQLLWAVLLTSVFTGVTVASAEAVAGQSSHLETEVPGSKPNHTGDGHVAIDGIPVVTFKWHHVETPYLIALWILACFVGKLGM